MPITISSKLVKAKDIKTTQINNLDLNQVLNLSWIIEEQGYGAPLDYTFFTMKKDNKVIGGAVVEHLEATESYYDGSIIMEDLHYMLSKWTILQEYRGNKQYAKLLIKQVLEVIKDPIGFLTDKSDCEFYYLIGGNPVHSIEDLLEGASYFLFNVDIETGKKLSRQFAQYAGEDYADIDGLWEFNSRPHTLENLNNPFGIDDEEEADFIDLNCNMSELSFD